MNRERLARLTGKQRECLRLVYAHMSSKEIAPILGVEPGTVDQYIKTAIRILGVPDRRAAALMLAEHEGERAQPLVYQPLDIEAAGKTGMFGASTGGGRHSGSSGGAMREDQTAFVAFAQNPALPLPIGGVRPSDVGWLKRLAWIVGIIVGVAIAFAGLIAGVDALVRMIVALNQQ